MKYGFFSQKLIQSGSFDNYRKHVYSVLRVGLLYQIFFILSKRQSLQIAMDEAFDVDDTRRYIIISLRVLTFFYFKKLSAFNMHTVMTRMYDYILIILNVRSVFIRDTEGI